MVQRIIFDILLFAAVLLLPWWVTALFSVFLIFYFRSFYEAVVAGFIMDLLFGAPSATLYGMPFMLTALLGLILVLAEVFKKKLRIYQ